MALYKQPRSPFWWMYVEPTGKRSSTKIAHTGTTSQRTKELKQLAQFVYETATIEGRKVEHGLAAPSAITFRALAEWYRTNVAALHRGKDREGWALDVLIAHFGDRQVSTIDEQAVLEWRAARSAQVRSGTVNRELSVLRAVFAKAIPRHLRTSPAANVKDLRPQRGAQTRERRPRILTPAEEVRLEAVMERPVDRALFLVALCTLVRQGDILDLRWRDVHAGYLSVADPKSGRSYDVPLAKRVKVALAALKKAGPYVFTHHRRGTAEDRRNRMKMWLMRTFASFGATLRPVVAPKCGVLRLRAGMGLDRRV